MPKVAWQKVDTAVHHLGRPPGGPTSTTTKAQRSKDSANLLAADKIANEKKEKPAAGRDFPRGGGSALTPLEYREAVKEANKELELFATDDLETKPKAKKRKSVSDAAHDSRTKKRKKTTSDKVSTKPKTVDILTYNTLAAGSRLFGRVAAISAVDLTISLPNQLTAFCPITAMSATVTAAVEKSLQDEEENQEAMTNLPDLAKLFRIGQWVRCVVTSLTLSSEGKDRQPKRRVEVSIDPELVNAALTQEDLIPGLALTTSVKSVEDHGYILNLGIPGELTGFLLHNNAKKAIDVFNAGQPFAVGQLVDCIVTAVSSGARAVKMSADPEVLVSGVLIAAPSKFESILPGIQVEGVVKDLAANGIVCSLFGVFDAHVDMDHLAETVVAERELGATYKVGQKVRGRITNVTVNTEGKRLNMSLAKSVVGLSEDLSPHVPVGVTFDRLIVRRVDPKMGLLLQLESDSDIIGYAHISRLADDRVDDLSGSSGRFQKGTVHAGRVVGRSVADCLLQFSLQPSVLQARWIRPEDVEPGADVRGVVKALVPSGAIIAITDTIKALCPTDHLSDVKLLHPEKKFRDGAVVDARVLATHPASRKVLLTCRKSLLGSPYPPLCGYDAVSEGMLCHGVVSSLKEKGVLVFFYGGVKGFAPINELCDAFVKTPSDVVAVGQTVRCRILSADPINKRMRVSLKGVVPHDEAVNVEDNGKQTAHKENEKEMKEKATIQDATGAKGRALSDEKKKKRKTSIQDATGAKGPALSNEKEKKRKAVMPDDEGTKGPASFPKASRLVPTLEVKTGFNWDDEGELENNSDDDAGSIVSVAELDATDGDDETDSDGADKKGKKKKKKKAPTSAALVARARAEAEASDLSRPPQVAADYERMLAGSPNSSYLWINYMAFQLQLSEVDKARAVAERALKAINFREGQEHMNVWVALMNLEDRYGDEGTLDAVVRRATQAADPKHLYLALIKVFERGEKFENAEKVFAQLSKKFNTSCKVWVFYAQFKYQRGDREGARELLQRSLKSLPKHKHIKTVLKFAQMEYRLGDLERGRTLFEGILTTHPKRVDLWNVYLDKEIRVNDKEFIRRIFQRITELKISSKKMKHFFKRWLAYEKEHGDEASQSAVKEAAIRYVESKV